MKIFSDYFVKELLDSGLPEPCLVKTDLSQLNQLTIQGCLIG